VSALDENFLNRLSDRDFARRSRHQARVRDECGESLCERFEPMSRQQGDERLEWRAQNGGHVLCASFADISNEHLSVLADEPG
jgi:hypothetical protein